MKAHARPPAELATNRPTVMAVYCPLWHSYDHMDSWKGIGWNEWQLLRDAKPRFKGHYQPIRPTWGCFDESNPKWAAKEIDLAADHGIDVFMIDWYWYNGVKIMEEALERGFLRAPNRRRIKFALMWANHDWADYFPAPPKPAREWNQWLPSRTSPADFQRMLDHCAERYFVQPNYWKTTDGALFYSIFDAPGFIEQIGGAEKTRRLLRKVDRRMRARGLPPMHWNGMTWDPANVPGFAAAGFHSVTNYNFSSLGEPANTNDGIIRYDDLMKFHQRKWDEFGAAKLDYFPVVTLGWDCTPRCLKEVKWPFPASSHYPYTQVVTGNTPSRFGQLCRDARKHLAKTQSPLNLVLINAWNEWTEGCYLLPEKRHGLGYLRALRDAFGLRRESPSRL